MEAVALLEEDIVRAWGTVVMLAGAGASSGVAYAISESVARANFSCCSCA